MLDDLESYSHTFTATQDQLSLIARLADEYRKRKKILDDATVLLELAQDDFNDIAKKQLPKALKEARLMKTTTLNGMEVGFEEEVHAKISEPNLKAAHEYLRERGMGDVIKNTLITQFDKGQDKKATELEEFLKEQKVEFERKESVHHSRLKALVKEQRKAGTPLDEKLFGVWVVEVATVSSK